MLSLKKVKVEKRIDKVIYGKEYITEVVEFVDLLDKNLFWVSPYDLNLTTSRDFVTLKSLVANLSVAMHDATYSSYFIPTNKHLGFIPVCLHVNRNKQVSSALKNLGFFQCKLTNLSDVFPKEFTVFGGKTLYSFLDDPIVCSIMGCGFSADNYPYTGKINVKKKLLTAQITERITLYCIGFVAKNCLLEIED